MAFRASTKPTKKSVVADSKSDPSTDDSTQVFSIDDVVGKPDIKLPVAAEPEMTATGLPIEETPEIPIVDDFVAPVKENQAAGGFSSERRDDYRTRRFSPRGPVGSGRREHFGNGSGRFNRDRRYQTSGGGSRFGGSFHREPRFSDQPNRPGSDFTVNGTNIDLNVPTETVRGILDLMTEGHGFLRPKFTPSERDVYISQSQIRRFMLRNGDLVTGQARQPKDNERYWGLLKVEKINEVEAEKMQSRPRFDDLVAIYPNRHLRLETGTHPLSTRIIDLIAPVGFGQRALIVSPPKAGKTTILKELAAGIAENYPNVHLMAALIGERPEEVTDLSRNIKGEVLASNFDQAPAEQTRVAEVALDRAKRLVEMGRDVVVLLDSITRLARAYNLVVNPSGRTLSGGFDPAALYPAKKFLGAARCVEKQLPTANDQLPTGNSESKNEENNIGGSLTVIGTALVDTGSRMDDLIYEEFKGTGNMELHLSRVLQERRIFPAIDVGKSGTRHDELLLGEETMKRVTTLRHMLSLLGDDERTLMLIDRLTKAKSNAEFLSSLGVGA